MIRIFTSPNQKIGNIGEEYAVKFLKKQGFSIIDRNVSNKYGELDIIAKKSGKAYFFEVKTGKSSNLINPAENLSKAKIGKFLISVEHYCLLHNVSNYQVQGIIVLLDSSNKPSFEILDLF